MNQLQNVIKEKIYRGRKSRSGKTYHEKQLAGYLVAGVVDGEVGIGFSLCHKKDRYDFVKGIRQPGFGLKVATNRALKAAQGGYNEIPPSLMKKTIKFVNRCERYYKGANMTPLYQQSPLYKQPVDELRKVHDHKEKVEEM